MRKLVSRCVGDGLEEDSPASSVRLLSDEESLIASGAAAPYFDDVPHAPCVPMPPRHFASDASTPAVPPRHLRRQAYLYIRQSTLRQVVENTESTERQYALRQRAVALGWPH
jgi:hypothetical protein